MPSSSRIAEASPERVVVLRALPGLGDFLCAVPALRALRGGMPKAHIALIGLAETRHLVERFSNYVDELIEFPGFPGLEDRAPVIGEIPSFLARMQERRFDLALQMHGSGIVTNTLTVLLGACHSAGFHLPNRYCPDPYRYIPYPSHEPEIWRNLRLIESLGIPLQGDGSEFPIRDGDFAELAGLHPSLDALPRNYVCVHAGASRADRRWSPDSFSAVADGLAARGFQIVLTGSKTETGLANAVARAMHAPSVNLAGRTSLGAVAALLSRARLVICNDTGISHLAAALRVPSVVVFTTSDLARWAPLDRVMHRVVGRPAPIATREHCGETIGGPRLRDECGSVKAERAAKAAVEPTVKQVLAEADELLRELARVA